MNSIQIGRAATAPVSLAPIGFFTSRPVHTPTVMSGSKPMNQASVLSSTVPVLPASGHSSDGAASRGAALDHALQQAGHHERGVGTNDVDRLGAPFLEQIPFAIGDGLDEIGLGPHTPVRKHGIGAGDFQQRPFTRAQRDRQIRRHFAREAEPLRIRHDARRADRFHHLDRRDVARLLERAPQRDRPLELVVVVLRLVQSAAAGGVADRLVDDQR